MVYFPAPPPVDIIHAYSTTPLIPDLRTSFLKDWETGSFFRFGVPTVTMTIHDRPEFHNLPQLQIREQLDREGFKEWFALIDDHTLDSHAIWWVESTDTSKLLTEQVSKDWTPPTQYSGEDFVLWHLRLLTQDLGVQYGGWSLGEGSIADAIPKIDPYDPHDMQDPPFTLGYNMSKKEDAQRFLVGPVIKARFDEVLWTTDPAVLKQLQPRLQGAIALTPAAAKGAGLLSQWTWSRSGEPAKGHNSTFQAPYDWDSPMWADPAESEDSKTSKRDGGVRTRRSVRHDRDVAILAT